MSSKESINLNMDYGKTADAYFQKHPNVLPVIQEFESRRALHLLKGLGQQQHDINFLSWLAEHHNAH